MATLLLVHGGLWEDGMNADRFWHRPGIVAGLRRHGFEVIAPDRPVRPADWTTEVDYLRAALPNHPVTVLAGSNGCSVAARLAIDVPGAVARLVLAWPATAGDAMVDARDRSRLAALGARAEVIDALLAGATLRGVADTELARLKMPAGVLASVPANPFHQARTARALVGLLPQADELPGCPEPPRPEFPPHLEPFLATVAAFAARSPG